MMGMKNAEFGHLSTGQQRALYKAFLAGESVQSLSRKYGLSTAIINRVIDKKSGVNAA